MYQSNILFGCTSIYKSSPLSLKIKKYSLHLVWILHVFEIFTKVYFPSTYKKPFQVTQKGQ